MRDPNRMRPYMERIIAAWQNVPDMRLGQLLLGAGVQFYTEDEDTVQKVEEFVRRITGKQE